MFEDVDEIFEAVFLLHLLLYRFPLMDRHHHLPYLNAVNVNESVIVIYRVFH